MRRNIAGVLFMVVWAGGAEAQTRAGTVEIAVVAAAHASQEDERAALSAMRRSLLDLASLQEMHHGGDRGYASDLAKLGFRARPGVSVSVLEATSAGWSASSTHRSLPGRSCVIYFGKASVPVTEGGVRPARAAALACDG